MADEEHHSSLKLDKTFEREIEGIYGTLVIKQAEEGDVGCVVWDAAIVLEKYLETEGFLNKRQMKGKRAIELGAGTGLVGLVASVLGADVVCTDLQDIIPLIELNIITNKHLVTGSLSAAVLKWGEDVSQLLPPFDYIFIADCIYYEESLEPLIKTMCDLSGPSTLIYLSYEERRTGNKLALENNFFKAVKEKFIVEEIPQEEQDSRFHSEDIHIIKLIKK
ncbi:protein-lysine methyltransferase METTL21D-like [Actinia tenebrosa]|uniref:Protein-lysine methyltransferase METTL21D-like n=1 Tax=Actinia tenebrosa TaxID=6105 RepID=A0A6P8IFM5_ACTTE|nr:protein-lysine methyltransferase METTL21D-like [Actinia tenebrosa]